MLTHGETAYDAALAAAGARWSATRAGSAGTGWIRLLGPLTRVRGAWSVEALRHEAAALPAEDCARPCSATAPRRSSGWLGRVLPTCATPVWACSTRSPAPPTPAVLTPVRARLAEAGPERLLDEVAPGLHYGPGVLDHVVLVTSPQVAPIVVELGQPDRTVIVHPPLARVRHGCGTSDGRSATRPGCGAAAVQGRRRARCPSCATSSVRPGRRCSTTWPCSAVPASSTCPSPPARRTSTGCDPEGFEQLAQAAKAFPLR